MGVVDVREIRARTLVVGARNDTTAEAPMRFQGARIGEVLNVSYHDPCASYVCTDECTEKRQ